MLQKEEQRAGKRAVNVNKLGLYKSQLTMIPRGPKT